MSVIGRSNKSALSDTCDLKKFLEMLRILIAHFLRAIFVPQLTSFLLDFQAVLISTNREKASFYRLAIMLLLRLHLQVAEAMNGVAVECSVEMADVRLCINVENR